MSLLLTTAFTQQACDTASAQNPLRVTLSDMPCAERYLDANAWASSPWQGSACDWLVFDGKQTLEIEHTLGRVPVDVGVYLSFSETGSSAAPSAGDSALIQSATDTLVTLRNNTNQRFWLRVTLR